MGFGLCQRPGILSPSGDTPRPERSVTPFRKLGSRGLLAVIAGLFLVAGGCLTPQALSPATFINTFERLNGVHFEFPQNHAKFSVSALDASDLPVRLESASIHSCASASGNTSGSCSLQYSRVCTTLTAIKKKAAVSARETDIAGQGSVWVNSGEFSPMIRNTFQAGGGG
jgi:hypothetical protein